MMSFFTLLINFFLKPQEVGLIMIMRIFGYLLLLIAAGIGLYFLFKFLVPEIGYIESGAVLTLIFAGGGCLLLFLSHQKRHHPVDDVREKATAIFKSFDIDKLIAKNSYKIILFSLVSGLVLSGLKGSKKGALNNLKSLLKTINTLKRF